MPNSGSLQTSILDWKLWRRNWEGRGVESKRARVGCQDKTRQLENLLYPHNNLAKM